MLVGGAWTNFGVSLQYIVDSGNIYILVLAVFEQG